MIIEQNNIEIFRSCTTFDNLYLGKHIFADLYIHIQTIFFYQYDFNENIGKHLHANLLE